MREIKEIYVHCSYSPFGDAELIRSWHKERGWRDIGYHKVILNGYSKSTKEAYVSEKDGLVEDGRPIEQSGAHAAGHNKYSIGVCIIGKVQDDYTPKQMHSLIILLFDLTKEYDLSIDDIYGHYEIDTHGKTCPNMDMESFRQILGYEFYKLEQEK